MFDLLIRFYQKEIPFEYLKAKFKRYDYRDESLVCIIYCTFLVQILFAHRQVNEFGATWTESDYVLQVLEERVVQSERHFARRNLPRGTFDWVQPPDEETVLTYFYQLNGPEGQPRHTPFSKEELHQSCTTLLNTYTDHIYEILVYFARTLRELPGVFDKSELTEFIRMECEQSVAEGWDHLITLVEKKSEF